MSDTVLIPWIGVTALGYVLGQIYQCNGARRRRLLLGIGLAMMLGFVVLRWLDVYGDPVPWTTQRSWYARFKGRRRDWWLGYP
jgi:uncharacterized membrane protein